VSITVTIFSSSSGERREISSGIAEVKGQWIAYTAREVEDEKI
jgi:hypothetical protein